MVTLKGKAIALTSPRVEVGDCVGKSTGQASYRNTAIPQTDKLSLSTRLETRGHQEHISTGIDLLGKWSVESKEYRCLITIGLCEAGEDIMVVLVACAEQHELALQGQHHCLERLGQQVETFLINQTRDHAHQWNFSVLGKTCFPLEGKLVMDSILQMIYVKTLENVAVSRWVDLIIVDAVQNPEESITTIAQQGIQFLSILGGEHFLGIALADSADNVGKVYASCHQIDHVGQLIYLRMIEEPIVIDAGYF